MITTIAFWLLIICIIGFLVTQAILPNRGNGDLKADRKEQRDKFFGYMEWLGVDYEHAKEAYNNIKNYKELVKANKILKNKKYGTTSNRQRATQER
jgi:hypothetical protein